LGNIRRKSINISQEGLLKAKPFQPDRGLPLVIEPTVEGVNLLALSATNRELIQSSLLKHGAVLFRNFNSKTMAEFEQFVRDISGELIEYSDQTSPRHKVGGNIYTSTDYPESQAIFLHNENSYASTWPLKIFFFCMTPPLHGGETPIADVRKVYQRISPHIRERFAQKGWMLVRNFGDGFGLSWQTVFQTTEKQKVNEFCRRAGIETEWKEGDRLKTRQVRQAIAQHPQTGEMVWFNHATFFHVSTLDRAIRETLLAQFNEEELPYNTYYGDGSPIEAAVLDELREAYREEAMAFRWQEGDILMVDNMLTAHGRNPYTGPRKIVVGMSEPCSRRGV
jgi:alpha-ketoglutarate-dependent taurine dioxygenase